MPHFTSWLIFGAAQAPRVENHVFGKKSKSLKTICFYYIFKDFSIFCVFPGPPQRSRGKHMEFNFFSPLGPQGAPGSKFARDLFLEADVGKGFLCIGVEVENRPKTDPGTPKSQQNRTKSFKLHPHLPFRRVFFRRVFFRRVCFR